MSLLVNLRGFEVVSAALKRTVRLLRRFGMEKLIIQNSRWKYVLLLIPCIGFVAAGIWMVIGGERFGWLSISFFGSCIPLFIWQIADSRPRLIIDAHGVLDRTLGIGRIAWSDIEAAYLRSISGNDFICLELKNPEKYSQKLSKVKRAMAAANRNLGFTDFNLNLSGVDARTDEVFELVVKYCHLAAVARPNSFNRSTS
jgi:hypothetical protein